MATVLWVPLKRNSTELIDSQDRVSACALEALVFIKTQSEKDFRIVKFQALHLPYQNDKPICT